MFKKLTANLNLKYDDEKFGDLNDYVATVTEVEDSEEESLGEAQMVMADKNKETNK